MITRGVLANQTGCNIETVRYYENVGLLPEPGRSSAGYRIYTDDHVRRLRFILRARELGFSGKKIENLLKISDGGDAYTRAEVKAFTETHIGEIAEKINDLEQLKDRLNEISSHCDGTMKSAQDCPIIVSLFGEDSV